MKTTIVNNNLNFFLIRFFFSVTFCYLTLLITGRIADMDFLLGFIEYGAGGTSSKLATDIYSNLYFLGNKYTIIAALNAFFSIILFFLLCTYIDKNNKYIWTLVLMSPGILIYANAPTKEALFIYPTIYFLILECNFLVNNIKAKVSFYDVTIQIFLLLFMFLIRGDIAFAYIFLFLICILIKNFHIKNISIINYNFNKLVFISFLISLTIIILISAIRPELLNRLLTYLMYSFENQKSIYRPIIDLEFVKNPFNFFRIQYLALFPTPIELIAKPYKLVIIVDSLLLIYSFMFSWKRLFKAINEYKTSKIIIKILFTYITVVYFTIFGLIGGFNLGSSQRLRLNYIPIGIIFPLLLERKIRLNKNSNFIIRN